MRRWSVVLGLVVVALGWAGPAVDRVSAAANLVRITSTLEPAALTIPPGDTVTWRNDDTQRHRIRSTSGPAEFDSGDLDPGESFTVSLSSQGTYAYRDDRDPGLSNYWGTVTVAQPTGSPSPGPTGGPGPTPVPGDVVIGMAGRVFSPSSVTISVGGHVTWRNDDSRDHTATSTGSLFDSGLMAPGASFVKTFTAAGTFGFVCLIHPDMTGTVTVVGAPGTTPPPPTPAPPPTPTPAPPAGDVAIVDFAFTPSDLTVRAGTRVTFANRGAAIHTVTATDGSFDSGLIPAGGTYARIFTTPGTIAYLCALHPTMAGTIRILGLNGATPPPPPAPTPTPAALPGSVRIADFSFLPGTIRISAGQTVTWRNTGVAPHTVTARDGSFGSAILARGAEYRRAFPVPGTYAYLCAIHPDMTGVILVSGPSGSVPPPAPEASAAPPSAAPPGVTGVTIVDLAFDPAVIHVPIGSTVRFTNIGAAIHTVTAQDGSFDSGFLATGEHFERRFDVAGTIPYVCALHPSMVGTVVVGGVAPPGGDEASASPGPSAAPGAAGGQTGPPGTDGSTGTGAAEPPAPRSALSIAIGALLVLGALAFGLAVVRGVGRRAEESGTIVR